MSRRGGCGRCRAGRWDAELTAHLGYEEGETAPSSQSNRRNGTSGKVLKGQDGELPVAIPRDRDSSFEPELVKKGQTRIDGMDDKSEPRGRHRSETRGER